MCASGHLDSKCACTHTRAQYAQDWSHAWAYLSSKHLFYAIKDDDNLYELDLRKVLRIFDDQSGAGSSPSRNTNIGDMPTDMSSTSFVLAARGASVCVHCPSAHVQRQWRSVLTYELMVSAYNTRVHIEHDRCTAVIGTLARAPFKRRQCIMYCIELYSFHQSAWYECRRAVSTQWSSKECPNAHATVQRWLV